MAPGPWALIAFDLDGTLADTESFSIPNLLELLANHYGLHLTTAQWFTHYHGMSGPSLLAKLNAEHGTTLVWEEFSPRRQAALEQVIRANGVAPLPGMLQMLRRVLAQGQQLALVSNSNPTRIALTLDYINGQRQHGVLLPHVFQGHIFSGTDPAHPNRRSKPAPDVYLAAAAHYQANPAACLALEDSATGVKAAVAAGFTCWGYTGAASDTHQAAAELTAAGASQIVTHWDAFQPA
ncbi:MAG: HAD family phosphatase [Alphaproteobacteria bacterium]|jgi:beta-phosphoglucomutase-like phosphatase (HAD superfamily)|nr:HAD family phosphatase [Alphaproteobacteria bacterium]